MTPSPTDSSPLSGKMHTRIFLVGFMGSGKSTHGKTLAHKIGYQYMDMDQLIEETAEMSIPSIFKEHGEKVFRKWEHDILLELCKRDRLVISTGGGAPCHGDMMKIMKSKGCTVYLELPAEALRDRLLRSRNERPLIKGKTESELLDFIVQLLSKRESYYQQADYTLDGLHFKMEDLVKMLGES